MPSVQHRNLYMLLLFLLVLLTIIFRFFYHNPTAEYKNYDATYHALLIITAYSETPASEHKFLPLVSLGKNTDKNIAWGSTVPDRHGNYYYTSFPSLGFIVPYFVFALLDVTPSVPALFLFNTTIQFLSTVLIFVLAQRFFIHLNGERKGSEVPAFLAALVSVFSMEALYSHGYIYWPHSLFQIFLLLYLLVMFNVLSDDRAIRARDYVSLFLFSVLLVATEWSGYLVIGGTVAVVLIFGSTDLRLKIKLILSILGGAFFGLVLFVGRFLATVNASDFFHALLARLYARKYSDQYQLTDLLAGYGESYGYFLILIPIAMVAIFSLRRNPKSRLILLLIAILVCGLVENLFLEQHAIFYTYDRLKFLPLLAFTVPVIWYANLRFTRICSVAVIVGGSFASIYQYPDLRITYHPEIRRNDLFLASISFSDADLVGTKGAVRGYTNLLFHRGVVEGVSLTELIAIAEQKNMSSVYWFAAGWLPSSTIILEEVYEYTLESQEFVHYSLIPCGKTV